MTIGCVDICARSSYVEELEVSSYELPESETAAFGVFGWVSISLRPSVVILPPPGFAFDGIENGINDLDTCLFQSSFK